LKPSLVLCLTLLFAASAPAVSAQTASPQVASPQVASPQVASPPSLGDNFIGSAQIYIVEKGDSLSQLARRFDVGAVELQAANPEVDWRKLAAGDILTLPLHHILPQADRTGIVINLAEMRLFFYRADGAVETFPISVGREGWRTPTGRTRVMQKRKDPTWVVPPSIRAENPKLPAVVPPGPKNPLGQYALNLGWPGYAIHGTNAPSSIGKPVSHGCIRMYPEDIARLFQAVEVGTPVTVVDQAFALAQGRDGHLYLQVLPDRVQARRIARHQTALETSQETSRGTTMDEADLAALQMVLSSAASQGALIDMAAVNQVVARRDGLPSDITVQAATDEAR